MADLYFTPKDGFAFWVSGYDPIENISNVDEQIKALTELRDEAAVKLQCPTSEVRSFHNSKPPRFQYMRIMYCKRDTPPDGAFVWEGILMHEVLTR